MADIRPPAPRPCVSCPYRLDVPSGLWDREEYEKLPDYDAETGYQPPSVFMCHQQDGRLCAGWCGTHDMVHSLSLRLASSAGKIDDDDIDAILDYETEVPLFRSGLAACLNGLAEIDAPGEDAQRLARKLARKLGARA